MDNETKMPVLVAVTLLTISLTILVPVLTGVVF